ncbi:MAG: Pyruvate kinase, partial [Streblomastix strix]
MLQKQSSAQNLLQYKREFVTIDKQLQLSPSAKFTPLTKIVATLGPSTNDYESISKIVQAGVNVVRMNFSHGDYKFHQSVYDLVRKIASDLNKEIAILADLQGPKVRCGNFPGGKIELKRGSTIPFIYSKDDGTPDLITTTFKPIIERCKVGEPILMDDGLLRLTVKEKQKDRLILSIEQGGFLGNHKGINLPFTDLGELPSLTEKDIADANFVLKNLDVDFFALSFVRRPQDVLDLRKIIDKAGKQTRICAKIEKPEAVRQLDAILQVVDSVMVARGDLAVEVGVAKVPCLQKHIIRHCLDHGIPVITATQMLESMTHNPTPTRAEATDVANAIFDGTDCVMLSGETAAGEFPTETVAMMQQIILETEFQLHLDRRTQYKNKA